MEMYASILKQLYHHHELLCLERDLPNTHPNQMKKRSAKMALSRVAYLIEFYEGRKKAGQPE